MNKRGFTLVELLAVIVILSVILAIAVPAISSIVENAQINAFKSNEKMLLKAAKTYISVDESLLPTNIGDTTEITLENLEAGNYLSNIKAPDNKSRDCNGYVTITKLANNNYDYTPYLNCQTDIGNSTEDSLVAHYKFDDFQEPTENLANTTASRILAFHNQGAYLHVGAGSSLAPEKGVGWYKFQISKIGNNFRIAQFPYLTQPNNNTRSYAIEFDFGNTSGYYWRIDGTTAGDGEIIENGKWVGIKNNTSGQSADQAIFLCNNGINQNVNDVVYYRYYQIEQKNHNTPFADIIREGVVKDYSGNNHAATLQLTSTPQWIGSGKNSDGAYKFNGLSNVISTNSFSLGTNLTVCFWAKPASSALKEMIMHGNIGDGALEFYQDGTQAVLRGGASSPNVTSSNNLTLNEWSYMCGVISGTTGKVYNNGVLKSTGTVAVPKTDSRQLNIGAYNNLSYPFDGVIDEVRVYNRALSIVEIKQIYNSEK